MPQDQQIDYFEGVGSLEALKQQYRSLMAQAHPDVGGDLEDAKEINLQYARAKLRLGGLGRGSVVRGEAIIQELFSQVPEASGTSLPAYMKAVVSLAIDIYSELSWVTLTTPCWKCWMFVGTPEEIERYQAQRYSRDGPAGPGWFIDMTVEEVLDTYQRKA